MRRFERIPGRAAEALDGTVYAIAARQVLGAVDFEERARRLKGEASARPPAPTVRRIVRSAYMA